MGRVRLWGVRTGALTLAAGALVAPTVTANAADALFEPYVTYDLGSRAANVTVGDVTGDGRPDVLVTTGYENDPATDYSLWVYAQQPDGTLGSPTQLRTSATYGSEMAVAVADVNEDGDLDVAVTTAAGVEIFEQNAGSLSYTWTVAIEGGRDLELVDVSGDGLADLVVNSDHGIEIWWQIYGDFMYAKPTRTITDTPHTEVEVADVTGDGLADLVTATGDNIEVRAQLADQSFAGPVAYASGGVDPWDRVNGLAVGDTDGDGLVDVHTSVGGNRPNAWVATLRQLPDGTLAEPFVRESHDIPESLEVADVTGDGRGDLVTLHGGHNRLGVYDMTPGTMQVEQLYAIPYASHYDADALAIGDVSGDGRADVAVGDYNNGLVLLRGTASASTAPDTTITYGPSGTIRSTSATFAFTATPTPAYYECSMDGAAWQRCPAQMTYTDLKPSTDHVFRVRGVGADGSVESTPATRAFTVDAAADVAVTLEGTPDPVRRGDTITYSSHVTNLGPDPFTDLVVRQDLPSGVTFEAVRTMLDSPASSPQQCTSAGSPTQVRCDLQTLAPGDAWTMTVTAKVTARKGSLTSTAWASGESWDLDQGNDSATVSTQIGSGGKGGGKVGPNAGRG